MMMLKIVTRATLLLTMLLIVLGLGATAAGHVAEGDVITAISTLPEERGFAYHLVDVNLGLTFQRFQWIPHTESVLLAPNSRRALILAVDDDYNYRLFHLFDFTSRRRITVNIPGLYVVDRTLWRNFRDYDPLWSPDSSMIMLRHPAGRGLFVADINSGTTRRVLDTTPEMTFAWTPEHDIAYRIDGAIYVLDLEAKMIHVAPGSAADYFTLEESPEPTLIDERGTEPSWSNDHSHVAYIRRIKDTSRVFVTRSSTDGGRYLTEPGSYVITFAYWP